MKIVLADQGRVLWGSSRVRNFVEFNDSPAAEITSPPRFLFGNAFHILDMYEEKTIAVLADRLYRIAATLETMRNVQFQLDIARIAGLHHAVHLLRTLSERTHVVVVSELDS